MTTASTAPVAASLRPCARPSDGAGKLRSGTRLAADGVGLGTASGRRWLAVVLVPLLLAVLLGVLAELRLFRLTNGLLFDIAVSGAPAAEPQAIVVRAPPENSALVAARLRALGAQPLVLTGEGSAGGVSIPPSTYGITRRVELRDGSERLIRLPADAVMPELSAHQLGDGSIPAGALDGVTAIVAPPSALDPPRFEPSGIAGGRALGAADFQARAIHALKSGRSAVEVAGLARFIVLVLAALLLPLAIAALPPRRQANATMLLVALLIAAGLLLVRFAGLLAPVTELVLIAALGGSMATAEARAERDRRLALLADRAGAYAMRNSLLPDPRRWIDFFPAAARLAGVESSIILETNSDGLFDLRAAFGPQASHGAAGLSRTDDFDRADETHPEPVEVQALAGWTNARLARLDSAGDAPVYWLFTVPDDEERSAVLAAAARLARYAAAQPGLATPSRRARRRHPLDVRLYGALSAMISRAGELRGSLGALRTATILFDGMGVPLQVNAAMERLLRVVGLPASRATPVDVAAALARIDPESARAMLGDLVRRGGELTLSSNSQIGVRHFVVRVTQTSGDLLFEAIDVTDLQRLASIQKELATEIDARIRNDLEAIELATRLATDERLPGDRRERALAMIGQAANRTRNTLDDLGRLVDASIYVSEGEPYPVNPRSAVLQAVAAMTPAAEKSGVAIEVRQPALTGLVLAEPELLDTLLRAMLEISLSDSARGSAVELALNEGEQASELIVAGGFGLPADRWAAVLSADDRGAATPIRVLRFARSAVDHWGGSLEATSEAGQGYRFTLRLRKS